MLQMHVKDIHKLLQFSGALPVELKDVKSSSQSRRKIKLSLKFMCIYILQILFLSYRLFWLRTLLLSSEVKVAVKLAELIDITWIVLAHILPLLRLQGTALCLHQATEVLSPTCNLGMGFSIFSLGLELSFFILKQNLSPMENFRTDNMKLLQLTYQMSYLASEVIPLMFNISIMMVLFGMRGTYDDINNRISDVIKSGDNISSQEIADLAERHWHSGDLLENISDTFGLDLLFFSAFNFFKLALRLYMTYIMVMAGEMQVFSAIRGGGKSLVLMTRILLLSVSATHPQRAETLGLLYRLLRRRTGSSVDEIEVRRQIRIFQTQIQSRDIRLSACGFFDVDKPHFYGLIMQVTTYFILLLQFQAFQ